MTSIAETLTPVKLKAELVALRWLLRPPPKMSLIEWADRYRQVASSTSATPGQWRTNAQPVAFGPMAAIGEPDTVTIMSSTQVLKTETQLCIAGYFIDQDPAPILMILPTQAAAEAFSKERFAPMVAATPRLARLVDIPTACFLWLFAVPPDGSQ
jgi:phage terminase large subunit GpA-like protein